MKLWKTAALSIKAGEVVGHRMPDGLIIDDDGALIGVEESEKSPGRRYVYSGGNIRAGRRMAQALAPAEI